MLTEEQMKQLDIEVSQRSKGLNPDVTPVNEEADSYAFTPEATVPEAPMPAAYTPEPSNGQSDDLYNSDAYITGPEKIEPNMAAKEFVDSLQRFNDNVKKTNIWKRYTYGRDDVLREARDISIETGIPENAILYSPQTLDNARNVYNYRRKQMELMPPGSNEVSLDIVTQAYPGLKDIIENGSEVDAAIALQNIKNVKQINGLVDAARSGWKAGWMQHEIANIGKKAFREGRAINDEEFAAAEKIQKQIEDLRQAPSFVEDPLLSIVGGTAQQVPQQLRGIGTGALFGAAVAATAAGAAALAAPFTGGISAAAIAPAARTGWSWGMRAGYAVDMWEDSAGQRYLEYSRFKDKDGKRVLTDEEARAYAAVAAAVETGIEFMNAGKIIDVLKGNKSAAARQIEAAVAGATDQATFMAALKRVLSGATEVAVSETLEEGGQEAADRVLSTLVSSYKGGNIPKYTPGQVLEGAIENMAAALPATLGFGFMAAGGGSFGLVRKAAQIAELRDLGIKEQMKNITGIHMLQDMVKDAGVKDFFHKDADIAKKVLHDTVEGTGYEKVNIDTQMVLQQEGGLTALRDIAQAAGMSADEIQNAVETGADITVPTEVFFQAAVANENFAIGTNFISFSDTAPSFARNAYYAQMQKAEMDSVLAGIDMRQAEQQQKVIDDIVQRDFAPGLEQDAAASILVMRPDKPLEGWQDMRNMVKQQLDDMLAPVIRELKKGMKQGVDIIRVEGDRDSRYVKQSNNAEWARKFYAENKRWPTQFELEGMAIDILSGRDFTKLPDYQNRPEMQEFYDANEAQIQDLLDSLDMFDNIKEKIAAINPDDLQALEGMSKEAADVYRQMVGEMTRNAPNDAVRLSALAGAALLARHADRVAEAMRAAGKTNYTAQDYFRDKFGLRMGGTFQGGGTNTVFQVSPAEFNRQKEAVRKQYEGTNQWMKAPNGKDTKLTEDQWITVRTPAFKNWFGDWENEPAKASKVVDENGEPRVVYHGTNADFDTFDIGYLGAASGDAGWYGRGFYFAFSKEEAKYYGSRRVIEAFINLRNPLMFIEDMETYDGLRSNTLGASSMVFLLNIADKFPEMAKDKTIEVFTQDGDIEDISVSDFAKTVKDVMQNVDFRVDEVQGYNGPEYILAADRTEHHYTDSDGNDRTYIDYGFQRRFMYKEDAENKLNQAYLYIKDRVYDNLDLPSVPTLVQESNFNEALINRGYDGVIQSKEGDEVVAFEPNQIKDASGRNVGFDPNNNNIYFQASEPGQNLVAYHNVNETKLMEAAKLGGMPMPSIAIVRSDQPFDSYGDITLIGTKDLIDPRKGTDLFSRDAYTVVTPRTYYNPDNNTIKEFKDKLLPYLRKVELGENVASSLEYELQRGLLSKDDFISRLENNLAVKLWYAKEVGKKNIVIPHMKKEYKQGSYLADPTVLKAFEKVISEDAEFGSPAYKELSDAIKKMLEEKSKFAKLKGAFQKFLDKIFAGENYNGVDAPGLLNISTFNRMKYEYDAAKSDRIDAMALKEKLDKIVLGKNGYTQKYEKFVESIADPLYVNPKIELNGHKVPATLDNIVRVMRKSRSNYGNESGGGSPLVRFLAGTSKKFKSVKEAKEYAGLIERDAEKIDASMKQAEQAERKLREDARKVRGWEAAGEYNDGSDAVQAAMEALKEGGSDETIERVFRKEYSYKGDLTEVKKDIRALKEAAENVKTYYYEAKPARAVGFNEFAAAVVPDYTSKETLDYLKSQGVAVTKYNPSREGDRQAKTQKAAEKANVYFQRQQRQGDTIQGATEFAEDGRRIVSVFNSGNESTMAHELGHIFVADLKELAEMQNAPEQIKKDWETVKKWLGWKPGQQKFTTKQQEQFARGFEAYLRTGEAPATGLKKIFRDFKRWLTRIYKDFLQLGGKPSEDIRQVMGRMLATDEEVEQAFKLRQAEAFEKAGGFEFLAKDSMEMYQRWQREATEYAKEKVLAQAIKDLKKQRADEMSLLRDQMADDFRAELAEKPLYQAELLLSQNPKMADALPDAVGMTYEEYTQAIAEQGTLEQATQKAVDAAMKEVEEGLPMEEIKQQAEAAVDSSEYRGLYLAFEHDFIEKKMRQANTLDRKILQILDDLEKAAYDANIETVDPEGKLREGEPKEDSPLQKKIKELKYHARWNEAEMKAINRMERAEDKAELQRAVKEFKAIFRRTRQNVRVYRDTAVTKYKLIKEYAAEKMAEMPISDATNVNKWRALEKRYERESIEALKKALDADLRYKQEESGLVPVQNTEGQAQQVGSGTQVATTETLPAKRRAPAARETVSELWQKANEAKLRQRIFAEYAALAQKNKTFVQKKNARLQARAKTIRKNNNIPANERYMYNHGLYVLGLAKQDAQKPQEAMSIMDMVKGYADSLQAFFVDEDGNITMPDYALSAMTGNTPYKDGYTGLTMEQYKYFFDMLSAIYKAGVDANKVKSMKDINGNTVLISDIAEQIVAETGERVPLIMRDDVTNAGSMTVLETIQDKARRARVDLTKPETVLQWMGPTAYRYIYETVNQSWNKERIMLEQTAEAVKGIWAPYTTQEKSEMRSKRQFRFGTSLLTREEMICVAFNWGTEINRKRVMDGYNVDERTVQELLSNLTQKDWQMVTSVWELVNSYWPETVRVEESMTGTAPEKQSAMPFEITGKDGNVYKLNGGYYPIKYDPSKSLKAANQSQDDAAKQAMANNAAMNRNRGFTKQRVSTVKNRPLLLSFNVLNKHLNDVIHNICFRESLRDVNRIIKHPDVSQAIQDHFGIPQARALEQWVRDCWAPDVQKKDAITASMEFFRHKQTAAVLGYRVTTAALNALNIYPMTDYLGAARTIEALQKFYSDPRANWQFALDRSIFLRQRAETMDRDAGEVLRKEFIGGYGTVVDTVIRGERFLESHAFEMLAFTDCLLACPLWTAEYQRVYQEMTAQQGANMTAADWQRIEMEAVAAGDKAVRTVFGSGETKDLAPVQKGTEMTKALTMFYSYFNVVFNALYSGYAQGRQQAMGTGGAIQVAPLLKKFVYWTILTGVTEGLMRFAIDAMAGGDDDPEELAKKMAKGVSDNIAGTIPVFRDMVSILLDKVMGERYFSARPLPAYGVLDTGMKFWNTVESDKKTKIDVFREGMRITNGFTGIGNTITDALATTAYWADTDFDTPFYQYLAAVIFDKRIDKKKKR